MYMFETTEKFRQMRENVPKFCGIEMYKKVKKNSFQDFVE